MKDAEAIQHRGNRVDVVLELVGRSWLDDEQSAVGFEQSADLLECRLRCGEVVDAVAGGDQVEAFAAGQIAGVGGDEGDPVRQPRFGGGRLRLMD